MIARMLKHSVSSAIMLAVVLAVGGGGAAAATASPTQTPHWTLMTVAVPTYFHAGDQHDFYEVVAMNDGGAPTSGEIVLTDTLPRGVTVTAITGAYDVGAGFPSAETSCGESAAEEVVTVTCRAPATGPSAFG
jgi:uncharacterized repeat protein (TIGR01451 family)